MQREERLPLLVADEQPPPSIFPPSTHSPVFPTTVAEVLEAP